MVVVKRAIKLPAEKRVGPRASAAWLSARGLYAPVGVAWQVTISLGIDEQPSPARRTETQLDLAIDANEWGLVFRHGSGTSWIRVLDAPTIERDDFGLIAELPPLRNLGVLVESLEQRFKIRMRRQQATIRTNIPSSDQRILLWVVASL
jgi:hypothetical protein